jgi:hypothetical protein
MACDAPKNRSAKIEMMSEHLTTYLTFNKWLKRKHTKLALAGVFTTVEYW